MTSGIKQTVRRILACSAIGALAVTAAPAIAQTRSVSVSIPAQDASAALREFAKKVGVQLVYQQDAIKGVTTNSIEGTLDVEEGLRRMLDGTGLDYHFSRKDVVVVSRKSDVAPKRVSYAEGPASSAETAADRDETRLE